MEDAAAPRVIGHAHAGEIPEGLVDGAFFESATGHLACLEGGGAEDAGLDLIEGVLGLGQHLDFGDPAPEAIVFVGEEHHQLEHSNAGDRLELAFFPEEIAQVVELGADADGAVAAGGEDVEILVAGEAEPRLIKKKREHVRGVGNDLVFAGEPFGEEA